MANFNVGERTTIEFQFQYNKEQLNQIREAIQEVLNSATIDLGAENKKQLENWLKNIDKGAATFSGITHQADLFGKNIESGAKSTAKVINALNEIDRRTDSVDRGIELINTGLNKSLKTIQTTKSILDKFGDTLFNSAKWTIATSAVKAFQQQFSNAANHVYQIDKSLNNIRIVTKQSAEEMEHYLKNANKLAEQLGTTTNRYAQASLIFYQQGLGDKEVEKRTQTTIKAANVTKQAVAEVSENLTALWNGFQVTEDQIESSIDKIAAVAAHSASNLAELTTAMSKTASVAKTLGIDLDQLTAQISTIISATRQAPESVGTALRTLYGRMADLVAGGTDEFGVSLGKVSGQLKDFGIEILDYDGNLRDMGEVIEDVAKKWNTWTAAQKQAVAIAVAGKRQFNNIFALFENWDKYNKNLDIAKNSLGELQKQQDIFLESYEAKLQKISTSWESVIHNFKNDTVFKGFLEGINGVVKGISIITKNMGVGGITNLMSLMATGINTFRNPIRENLLGVINSQYTKNINQYTRQVNQNVAENIQSKGSLNVADATSFTSEDIYNRFERELTKGLSQSLYKVAKQFNTDQLLMLEKSNQELTDKVLPIAKKQADLAERELQFYFNHIFDKVDLSDVNISDDDLSKAFENYFIQKVNTLANGHLYTGEGMVDFINKELGFSKGESGVWQQSLEDLLKQLSEKDKEQLDTLSEEIKEINRDLDIDTRIKATPIKHSRKRKTPIEKEDNEQQSSNTSPIEKSISNIEEATKKIEKQKEKETKKDRDWEKEFEQAFQESDDNQKGKKKKRKKKEKTENPSSLSQLSDLDKQFELIRLGVEGKGRVSKKDLANLGIEVESNNNSKTTEQKEKTPEKIETNTQAIKQFEKTVQKEFDETQQETKTGQQTLAQKLEQLFNNPQNNNNKDQLPPGHWRGGIQDNNGNITIAPVNKDVLKPGDPDRYLVQARVADGEVLQVIPKKDVKNPVDAGVRGTQGFNRPSSLPGFKDGVNQINFDMDGTIADLYGYIAEQNGISLYEYQTNKELQGQIWTKLVKNLDVSPYKNAKPLINMTKFKSLLEQLQGQGWQWGITSWLAGGKEAHPEYDALVRKAKKEWLAQYGLNPDETHIVKYGTNKGSVTAHHDGEQILYDDEYGRRREFKKYRDNNISIDQGDIIGSLERLLFAQNEMPIVDVGLQGTAKNTAEQLIKHKDFKVRNPKFPHVYTRNNNGQENFEAAYKGIENQYIAGIISKDQKDLIDMMLSSFPVFVGGFNDFATRGTKQKFFGTNVRGNQAFWSPRNSAVFLSGEFSNDPSILAHELFHAVQNIYHKENILEKTVKTLDTDHKDLLQLTPNPDSIKVASRLRAQKINDFDEYSVKTFRRAAIEYARQQDFDAKEKQKFIFTVSTMLNELTGGKFSDALNLAGHDEKYYKGFDNPVGAAANELNSEYAEYVTASGELTGHLTKFFESVGLKSFLDSVRGDYFNLTNNKKLKDDLNTFRTLRGYEKGVNGDYSDPFTYGSMFYRDRSGFTSRYGGPVYSGYGKEKFYPTFGKNAFGAEVNPNGRAGKDRKYRVGEKTDIECLMDAGGHLVNYMDDLYANSDYSQYYKAIATEYGTYLAVLDKERNILDELPTFANGGTLVNGPGQKPGMSLTKIPDGVLQPGDPDRYLLQARVADGEALQVIPKKMVKGLPGYKDGNVTVQIPDNFETYVREIRDSLRKHTVTLSPETIALLKTKLNFDKDKKQEHSENIAQIKKILGSLEQLTSDDDKTKSKAEEVEKKSNDQAIKYNQSLLQQNKTISNLDKILDAARYVHTSSKSKAFVGSIGTNIANVIQGDFNPIAAGASLFGSYQFMQNAFKDQGIKGNPFKWMRTSIGAVAKAFNDGEGEGENKTKGLAGVMKLLTTDTATLTGVLAVAGVAVGAVSAAMQVWDAVLQQNAKHMQEEANAAVKRVETVNTTITSVQDLTQQYKEQKISALELRSQLLNVTKEMKDASIAVLAFSGDTRKLTRALEEERVKRSRVSAEAVRASNQAQFEGTNIFVDWGNTAAIASTGARSGYKHTSEEKAQDILKSFGLDPQQIHDDHYLRENNRIALYNMALEEMARDPDVSAHSSTYNRMVTQKSKEIYAFSEENIAANSTQLKETILNAAITGSGRNPYLKTSFNINDFNTVFADIVKGMGEVNMSAKVLGETLLEKMQPGMSQYNQLLATQRITMLRLVQEQVSDINEVQEKLNNSALSQEDVSLITQYGQYMDFKGNKSINDAYNQYFRGMGNFKNLLIQMDRFQKALASDFVINPNFGMKEKSNFIMSQSAQGQSLEKTLSGWGITLDQFNGYRDIDLTRALLNAQKERLYNVVGSRSASMNEITPRLENAQSEQNEARTNLWNYYNSHRQKFNSDIRGLNEENFKLKLSENSGTFLDTLYNQLYKTTNSSYSGMTNKNQGELKTFKENADKYIDSEKQLAEAHQMSRDAAVSLVDVNKQIAESYRNLAKTALENITNMENTLTTLDGVFTDFNDNGTMSIKNWTSLMQTLASGNMEALNMYNYNNGQYEFNDAAYTNYMESQKTATLIGTLNSMPIADMVSNAQSEGAYSHIKELFKALDEDKTTNYEEFSLDQWTNKIIETMSQLGYGENSKETKEILNELSLSTKAQSTNLMSVISEVFGLNQDEVVYEDKMLALMSAVAQSVGIIANEALQGKQGTPEAKALGNGLKIVDDIAQESQTKYLKDATSGFATALSISNEDKDNLEKQQELKELSKAAQEELVKAIQETEKQNLTNAERISAVTDRIIKVLEANGGVSVNKKEIEKITTDVYNNYTKNVSKTMDYGIRTQRTDLDHMKDQKKAATLAQLQIDYYAQINRRLAVIQNNTSRLSEMMQHTGGASNITNYQKQIELATETIKLQQETQAVAKGEQIGYKTLLEGMGIDISDYVVAQQQIAAFVNDKDKYNIAKKYYDSYRAAEDKELSAGQAQQNAEFELANARYELGIARQKAMIDYLGLVQKGNGFSLSSETNRWFRTQFRDNYGLENNLLSTMSNNEMQQLTNNILGINSLYTQATAAQGKTGDFRTSYDALQKMIPLYEAAQQNANQIYSNLQQAYNNLTTLVSDAASQFDVIQSKFNLANNALSTMQSLIESTQKAGLPYFDKMDDYYKGLEKTTSRQINSLYTETRMWKDLYETAKEGSKEQMTYFNQYQSSLQEARSKVVELANTYKEDLTNGIKAATEAFEDFVGLNHELDFLSTLTDFDKEQSNKYYDDVEKISKIQIFGNTVNNDLETSNYSDRARKQILKFYEEQEEYLRNREALTENDLKLNNLKYELLKKQIALEESQNAKNAMKLVRNSQGNWSYQYVADEQDKNNLENEIHDIYQQIQDLQQSTQEEIQSRILKLYSDLKQQTFSISANEELSIEERAFQIEQLRANTELELSQLMKEYGEAQQGQLANSADWLLFSDSTESGIYDKMNTEMQKIVDALKNGFSETYNDTEKLVANNFDNVRDYADQILDHSQASWSNYATSIINQWTADNGTSVKNQMEKMYQSIIAKTQEYQNNIRLLQEQCDISFNSEQGIVSSIDRAVNSTNNLNSETSQLAEVTATQVELMTVKIDQLEQEWNQAASEVKNIEGKVIELQEYVRDFPEIKQIISPKAKEDVANTIIELGKAAQLANSITFNTDKDPTPETPTTPVSNTPPERYTAVNKYGDELMSSNDAKLLKQAMEKAIANGRTEYTGYQIKKAVASYDTGGYTGDWSGDEGKLAILHKKEQIFNADDTQLLHNAVQILSSDNLIKQALISYSNTPHTSTKLDKETQQIGDVYNVTANFPNANSAEEIKQALLSLPNIMSQYITTSTAKSE